MSRVSDSAHPRHLLLGPTCSLSGWGGNGDPASLPHPSQPEPPRGRAGHGGACGRFGKGKGVGGGVGAGPSTPGHTGLLQAPHPEPALPGFAPRFLSRRDVEGQWGLRCSGTPLYGSVETSPLRVGRLLEAGPQWGLEGYLLPDVPLVSTVPLPPAGHLPASDPHPCPLPTLPLLLGVSEPSHPGWPPWAWRVLVHQACSPDLWVPEGLMTTAWTLGHHVCPSQHFSLGNQGCRVGEPVSWAPRPVGQSFSWAWQDHGHS